MKRPFGVRIEGFVYSNEGDLGHNEFLDALLSLLKVRDGISVEVLIK
ncbi:hypothetical protein PthBH41_01610 [Parageobacillus thermoglucosidasius]|jgi:hypothetical protein|nr:hypothetical protein PthBH41_01610 [Parageobacillus thermoglucosidasius]